MFDAFKHDSNESNKYLYSLYNKELELNIKTPSTIVITRDGFTTENYKQRCKEWGKWILNIKLKELEAGGHYLLKTIPADVVRYLKDELDN